MAIEVPDWYRTVALVGVDLTGTPVVVLLDSTGAIMAVMKGEYAGTLKNIAVDASGRVIMIPTDPADVWGNAISMGNAELAAVLSPAKRYDRRGNVVWIDSFEDGLVHINPLVTGAVVAGVLTSGRARTGAYSLKWALGPTAADLGRIYKAIPYSGTSKIGMEISFTCHADLSYIYLAFGFNTATTSRIFGIRYDYVNENLKYRDIDGNHQTFATGISLSDDDRLFHTAKLVIDIETDTYVRFMLDSESPDLPNVVTKVDTGLYENAITSRFDGYPVDTKSPVIYVDDWILTINEPA